MNVAVVESHNERVLTTEQVAQVYECEPKQIKQNFNNNKAHFEEGRHYYKVEGDELKDLRVENIDLQTHHKRTARLLLSPCALDVYL